MPDECRAAETAALRILGGAAQSQESLRRRLVHRGFSAEAAASAAHSAVRAGYVDDAALAASIVQRRRGRRGTARIAAELRARGVDPDVARTAVGAVSVEEGRTAALNEARRRVRGELPCDWQARRRELGRIAGALNRLGFSADAVAFALGAIGADAVDQGA
jgi:regulatory protein